MTDSSNSASCEVEILKGPSINISYWSLFCCWCITRHIASLNISSLSRQLLGRLSFLVTNDIGSIQAQNGQKSIYFTTDSTLIYTAFFADFGPLDLGLTYQFCQQLHELLKASTAAKKSVVYYCADHLHRRANSAVLLCSYLVRSYTISIFSEIHGKSCWHNFLLLQLNEIWALGVFSTSKISHTMHLGLLYYIELFYAIFFHGNVALSCDEFGVKLRGGGNGNAEWFLCYLLLYHAFCMHFVKDNFVWYLYLFR